MIVHHRCSEEWKPVVFEIEVFSDPLAALSGLPVSGSADEIRQYDEDLVKPAILLADAVYLTSHRIDLEREEALELEMTGRRVPVMKMYADLSQSRDEAQLGLLSISQSDLLSPEELSQLRELSAEEDLVARDFKQRIRSTNRAKFLAEAQAQEAVGDELAARWAVYWDRSIEFREALRSHFASRVESLRSPSLDGLVSRGLLVESPWDETQRSRPRQIIDNLQGEGVAFERAYRSLVESVSSSKLSVMLDDSVHRELLSSGGQVAGLDSARTVGGAVELMRMVEGVCELPIDELADVRRELDPYVGPFRSFLLNVAQEVPDTKADGAERTRSLAVAWQTDVEPAIAEMRAHVTTTSFVRNAIDVFANSSETTRTIGMAVGIVTAAGFAGFSTLTATAAIAPPALKALLTSIRAKQEVVRERAYFVHALGRNKAVQRAVQNRH